MLGEVNLYADGPSGGVNGNYTDGTSGIGTPALIIPAGFWGIEGVSRGATGGATPGPGTFLSVCMGSNNPVTGCHNSFPVRSLTVTAVGVVGNTMTLSVSPAANFGVNIYAGELVMMKGNSNAPVAENGMYKVQNSSSGSTVQVTVPSGTGTCVPPHGATCGTLYLGTPILGFGPGGVEPNGLPHYYNTPNCSLAHPCAAFGMHIKDLGFNCQGADSTVGTTMIPGIQGCMGWQNLYAQEESDANPFLITNFNFVGFDTHGNNAQNFGPIQNAEIYTGGSNANCDYGTTGAYIEGVAMRGFYHWTINTPKESGQPSTANCTNNPNAAVILDAADTEVGHAHCETFTDCVLLGANSASASGMRVTGIGDSKPFGSVVHISKNNSGLTDFMVENIQSINSTNTLKDEITGITLSSPFLSLYSWSQPSGAGLNLVTTDTTIRNQFGSGVQTNNLRTGVTTATDLAGQCVVGGLPSCSNIAFTQSYVSKPICTCSDTGTVVTGCNVQVTLGPPHDSNYSGY